VIANYGRRERRRLELTQRIGAHLRGAVGVHVDDGDAMLASAALGRLSDADREILLLVSWEGLSSAEVAVVLGCSPTAARIRLHRAPCATH
jgi:DNA-directed RNA polymerase specialized sigma24 family protein